jgi:transposase
MRFSDISYTHAVKAFKVISSQSNRLIEQFVSRTPARTAAALVGVNKISTVNFYIRLPLIISARLAEEAGELAGEVEVDESYEQFEI